MTVDYKTWNLKTLGNLFVLGLVMAVIIGMIHLVVSPLLMTILPTVFLAPLSLTETLLFLLLLVLMINR